MTEQFTPGSWIVCEKYGPDGWRVVAGGSEVATALYLGGTEPAKANARLIAAAPDYDAAAVKYLEVFDRDALLQCDPELAEVAEMFAAAQAKARGSISDVDDGR